MKYEPVYRGDAVTVSGLAERLESHAIPYIISEVSDVPLGIGGFFHCLPDKIQGNYCF